MKTSFLSRHAHTFKRVDPALVSAKAARSIAKLAKMGTLVGVFLGMIYFAPAAWLGMVLESVSQNHLSLAQARGTLWRGSGVLLIKSGETSFSSSSAQKGLGNTKSLGENGPDLVSKGAHLYIASPFNWQIGWVWSDSTLDRALDPNRSQPSQPSQPSAQSPQTIQATPSTWPAHSGLALRVENLCCTQSPWVLMYRPAWTDIQDGWFTTELSDSQISFPAQWLSALGVPWNTVDPRGVLNFEIRGASVKVNLFRDKAPVFQGVAELTLKDLSSRLSPLSPLGTYKVKLYNQNPVSNVTSLNPDMASTLPDLYISLETTEGRLELSGEGKWSNKHLYFNGLAKAQSGFEAALANLLGVLGTRTDNTATLKIG